MAKDNNVRDFFQDLAHTIRIKIGENVGEIQPINMADVISNYNPEVVGGFYESIVCAIEYGIKGVENVVVYNGVEEIRSNAYQGMTSLKNVKMFDSIKRIRDFAFGKCTSITEINLPASLETLAPNTFNQCSGLTKISHYNPDSTGVSIGGTCFNGCSKLKEVYFSNVAKIGNKAFNGCTSIESITILNMSQLPTIETDAFTSIPSTAIFYVQEGLLEEWKTALQPLGFNNVEIYTITE